MNTERCSGRGKLRRVFILLAALMLSGSGVSSVASSAVGESAAQSSAGANPDDLLRQGEAAIQAGQVEVGIEKYKTALNEVQQQDKRKRSAIELLLGITYQKARQWQESVDALNAAIQDNANFGYLPYSLLGFAYRGLGRWQDSLAAFQQADKLKPDDPGVQEGLGYALTALGRPKEAIEPLEKAVRQNPAFAVNHFALGIAYSQNGQLDDAIKEFNEAIRLAPDNFAAYLYLGEAFGRSLRNEQEITAEQQAIRLNPKSAEAYALLGNAYRATNGLREAASAYAKAAELKPDYFDAYAGLAFVDVELEKWSDSWKALQALERLNGSTNFAAYHALAISYRTFGLWQRTVDSASKAVKLKPDCAECYLELGYGYKNLGRADEARKAYEQALAIKPNYTAALAELGDLAETSGDFDAARNYLDAASRSLGSAGDQRWQTKTEGIILAERGNIERDQGNYAAAFGFYTRSVEKYRSIGAYKDSGTILIKIAEVYRQIGDYKASAQWYEYALEESKEAGDLDGQSAALIRLGLLTWYMGDISASFRYGHQAEELLANIIRDPNAKAIGRVLLLGETGAMWGELLAQDGEPAQAISFLQARIGANETAAQGEATLRAIAVDSVFLADAYIRAGQYDKALESLKRAEAIAEKYKSPEIVWVYTRMGEVREKQGDLEGAVRYYERAAEVLERLGAQQQLPGLQLSSREQTWGAYEDLTRVCLKLYAKTPSTDLLSRAFVYHEKGKTRGLLDLLNEAGVRAREGVDPTLVQREERLRAKLSALQSAFTDESISDLRKTSLQQALIDQEAALREVHEKIAAANPKYESLSSPKIAEIADIQAILGDDAVLLEYDLGPEFSGVGVVTNRAIHVYRLPSQDLINKALQEFLPTLRAPLIGKAEVDLHVKLAKELYLTLVGPVRSDIRNKHHIIIVPDDILYYLPFEALIAADEVPNRSTDSLASQAYLAKTYDFSYAPSASVLVALERLEAGKGSPRNALLAFGDPSLQSSPAPAQVALNTRGAYQEMGVAFERLPYSAEEVRRVAAAYGIKSDSDSIYLGSKATKKTLMGLDLTQYHILHFATHAVMGDEVKWINQPALILSPDLTGQADDGLLKMSEIFNLRLNASLVVLSACETARGKLSRGEGIVGLTSAFLFAGSRSVVASLWNVNDESTSFFMESFYTHLKSGVSEADALREARLETMRKQIRSTVTGEQESLASPYFWAPFVLIGEWNGRGTLN